MTLIMHLLRRFRSRSSLVEAVLGMGLDDRAVRSTSIGLAESGRRWGDLYAWKVEQHLRLRRLRRRHREEGPAGSERGDATDYGFLARLPARGVIVAIPHYGHYVESIIGLARTLTRLGRHVLVFYDPPSKHGSNAIFDVLAREIFGNEPLFGIVHNDRHGLLGSRRALRSGSVVVIMPDVYEATQSTYRVPFGGWARSAALGAAHLSRRADAVVVPCLSMPTRAGFETLFGAFIDPSSFSPRVATIDPDLQRDYRVTCELFDALHALMRGNYLPWQYISSHFAGAPVRLEDVLDAISTRLDLLELASASVGDASADDLRIPFVSPPSAEVALP